MCVCVSGCDVAADTAELSAVCPEAPAVPAHRPSFSPAPRTTTNNPSTVTHERRHHTAQQEKSSIHSVTWAQTWAGARPRSCPSPGGDCQNKAGRSSSREHEPGSGMNRLDQASSAGRRQTNWVIPNAFGQGRPVLGFTSPLDWVDWVPQTSRRSKTHRPPTTGSRKNPQRGEGRARAGSDQP